MKSSEIIDQKFAPLNLTECRDISGGVWAALIGAVGMAMLYEVLSDWDNFKAGLSGQPARGCNC